MAQIQCPECGSPADDQDLACGHCELILNPRAPGGRYVASQPSIVRALLSPSDFSGVREVPKPPPGHKVHEQETVVRAVSLSGEEVPRLLMGLDVALHPLHPFEAYVVSFCDGFTPVRDVALAAQLRMVEVHAVISSLLERRVIQLDRSGKRRAPEPDTSPEVERVQPPPAAPELDPEPGTEPSAPAPVASAPAVVPAPAAPTPPLAAQRSEPPSGRFKVVSEPAPRAPPPPAPAPRPPPPVIAPAPAARAAPAPSPAAPQPAPARPASGGFPSAPAPGGRRPLGGPTPSSGALPRASPPASGSSPPAPAPSGGRFNVSRSGLTVIPLDRAIAPNDAQNVLERAVALEKKGEVRGAIEVLKLGIAKVAQPAPLYNKLALILLDQRRDYAQAEELFQKAIEKDPNNPVYQQNLYRVVGLVASATVGDSDGGKKKESGFLSKLWKK